jgi:ubiquinol-cytochrome c reductase cytochrome b subunit
MPGSGSTHNTRDAVRAELDRLRRYDWRGWVARSTDGAVRGVMAGLSAGELRAILRGDAPTEKPNPRYRAQVKSFILHIRPKYYQRASTWFTHTWRLGWLAVFFFIVEAITGVLLMVFYAPTPERAYGDMLNILGNVPFGPFVRDLHRLAAEGMVAVVVLHMLRVFFTGSYKGPRRFTWFIGVALLLLTLLLSFSGYLLPWDQLAYWAVTIGTSMAEAMPVIGRAVNLLLRGAVDITAGGLLRFYLLHVVLLPLVALILISVHYYKVAREHSISLPASIEEGDLDPERKRYAEERVDLIPNLLIHELMLASVVLFLMVIAVATFFHAPLESHADPQVTPLHTQAPWYFLWVQGLLKLGNLSLMGVVVPIVLFALLFAVPWIDRNPHRLASKRKVAVGVGTIACIGVLILTYMGTSRFGIETPPAQAILAELVPATDAGAVRETPWAELETAPDGTKKTYFVSYPAAWASDPQYGDKARYEFIPPLSEPLTDPDAWHVVLRDFKAKVENQPELIAPVDNEAPLATVTVQRLQPKLKWLEFTITWDELVTDASGQTVLMREMKSPAAPEVEQSVLAIHEDANYQR